MTDESAGVFGCRECSRFFKNRVGFRAHKTTVHLDKEELSRRRNEKMLKKAEKRRELIKTHEKLNGMVMEMRRESAATATPIPRMPALPMAVPMLYSAAPMPLFIPKFPIMNAFASSNASSMSMAIPKLEHADDVDDVGDDEDEDEDESGSSSAMASPQKSNESLIKSPTAADNEDAASESKINDCDRSAYLIGLFE